MKLCLSTQTLRLSTEHMYSNQCFLCTIGNEFYVIPTHHNSNFVTLPISSIFGRESEILLPVSRGFGKWTNISNLFVDFFTVCYELLRTNVLVEVELKKLPLPDAMNSLRHAIHLWLHSKGRISLRAHEANAVELPNDEFIIKHIERVTIYFEPAQSESNNHVAIICRPGQYTSDDTFEWDDSASFLYFEHRRGFTCNLSTFPQGFEENEDLDVPSSKQCALPSLYLREAWDSLVFDSDIKSELIEYISTMMYFSAKNVNENLVSFNRVVLLHGPPGIFQLPSLKRRNWKNDTLQGNSSEAHYPIF